MDLHLCTARPESWKAAALRSMVPTHQLVGVVVLSPFFDGGFVDPILYRWLVVWDFFFQPQILPPIGLK